MGGGGGGFRQTPPESRKEKGGGRGYMSAVSPFLMPLLLFSPSNSNAFGGGEVWNGLKVD